MASAATALSPRDAFYDLKVSSSKTNHIFIIISFHSSSTTSRPLSAIQKELFDDICVCAYMYVNGMA
ncbi:hypothetical protein OSB04_006054 [Centaurea solstitialis]|uniref:Uncharacterized protein n=1 Tax=Centaurea solstitialis TaxID=347529 RepID=A0AA38TH77_9ASTR|nr:hypothetical protein OSB04_006054 [Centaurea solstitialis]